MEASEVHKSKRARSPGYPGIDLEEAMRRAQTLYDEEGRNAAPVDVILRHWGYQPKSGLGMVALAALKKFGLLADEGSGSKRRARLSQLALRILLDRPDSPERDEAIRTAALSPTIHRELLQQYPDGFPSDETLRAHLQLDRGFTERAVRELIPEFRRTIEFARIEADDSLSTDGEDGPSPEREPMTAAAPPIAEDTRGSARPMDKRRQYDLPLAGGGARGVTVHGSFPLSEQEWGRMLSLLEAMKPGLVTDPTPGSQQDTE